MPKITIIGAGSAEFSTEIIRDVLATSALESGIFALVDIHAGRLELAHQAASTSQQGPMGLLTWFTRQLSSDTRDENTEYEMRLSSDGPTRSFRSGNRAPSKSSGTT